MTARLTGGLAGIVVAGLTLGACSATDETTTALTPTESLTVTTSATEVAPTSESAEPVHSQVSAEKVKDPGLNVNFIYQGARSGQNGGTVITVAVENLNDKPLAPDALEQPTLRYNAGSGKREEVDPLSDDAAGIRNGLDLPLGAKATTNLTYAFDIAPGNLWDAELKIGNVVIEGNLNQ